MELTDFIQAGLNEMAQWANRAVDGLTHDELIWHPKPEDNSIGIILFQQARSEDMDVQSTIQGKTQIWESDKWYQKLNLPVSEIGFGYTAEQIAAFPLPELKDLLGYAEAVRTQTLGYLKGMSNDQFDKVVKHPFVGDIGIGALFALILIHGSYRIGTMLHLRSLQRGVNK